MSYDIDRDDEVFESLADYYEDYPEGLETVEGGPRPEDFSWRDEDKYFDALDAYKERRKTEEQSQIMADAVYGAAQEGIRQGFVHATDKDAEAAHLKESVIKYAELPDRALIDEAESLEAEWNANERRLDQALLEGDKETIQICESHRA